MNQSSEQVIVLRAEPLTVESFSPFGQVIGPTADGNEYGPQHDAHLDLSAGTPRLYIMRLPQRGRSFKRITYHAQVTQCLGGLAPQQPWYLAVASPTMSVEKYPQLQDLKAFRIPPGVFLKLDRGTWHAGPFGFDGEQMDFYNLELSDTNVVDHNTHDYSEQRLRFEVVD